MRIREKREENKDKRRDERKMGIKERWTGNEDKSKMGRKRE